MKFDFLFKSIGPLLLILVTTSCLDQVGTIVVNDGRPGAVTTPYLSNINQPTNLVCDALSAAGLVSTDPTAGLMANLFYLDVSQPRYTSVNDYIVHGNPVNNVSIYFNQVNVPTRPFDRGFFTNEGQVLLNQSGNTLYEYFGLEFQSDLVLTADDAEGDYQFAVLADDGAILATRSASGAPLDVLVSNDGFHPTKFGCATVPVSMNRQSRLPVNLRYFQGPRYHISAIVMFRPWPVNASDVNDVECGQLGNDRYFDSTQNPPAPQAAYNSLLARGWKPLAPSNYKVPLGIENSCNVPAPTISNDTVASVSTTTADITWLTDIPATSQVEYTDVATGVVSVTSIDTLLVYNHLKTLPNLTANTLYTATVISASASGKLSRGSQITFRTRR